MPLEGESSLSNQESFAPRALCFAQEASRFCVATFIPVSRTLAWIFDIEAANEAAISAGGRVSTAGATVVFGFVVLGAFVVTGASVVGESVVVGAMVVEVVDVVVVAMVVVVAGVVELFVHAVSSASVAMVREVKRFIRVTSRQRVRTHCGSRRNRPRNSWRPRRT